MSRSLIAALALILASTSAQARDVTGQMAYRERMALPDGAELKVELRNAEGIVAEVTIPTEGRQVPLPFVIVAPDAGDFTLQGAIFVDGRPEWVTAPLTVPAGTDDADLGVVPLVRGVGMGFMNRMRCGGTVIEAGYLDAAVRLRIGETELTLPQTISGSGARYSDGATPETVFWNKGNNATLTLKGRDLPECVPMIDPPLFPLTARGNEPFWTLSLTDAGYVYERNMGEIRREGPMPQGVETQDGVRFDAGDGLAFTLSRKLCRDTMAGMPYPMSVTVEDKGQALAGCAGEPVDLLAGAWTAEHVEGAFLPEGSEVSLVFDAATRRVYGKSACNRYNGAFTLTGEGLSFGPAAGTMMACPQDLMAVEQTFLKRLELVDRFDLSPDGALELFAGGDVVIRARR